MSFLECFTKSLFPQRNSVFENFLNFPQLNLTQENAQNFLQKLRLYDLQISKNRISLFKNLQFVIAKILLEHTIELKEFKALSKVEFLVLKIFIAKKYFQNQSSELSIETLNSLSKNLKSKRIEENVKFVFLKGIRFLEKIFNCRVYSHLRDFLRPAFQSLEEHEKIEYAFYGYYFGHLTEQSKLPIEAFFRPRYFLPKNRDSKAKHFPKTVSKMYISLVKLSRPFVRDFGFYLQNCFVAEMKSKILLKSVQMISDWESVYFSGQERGLVKHLSDKFSKKSRCKMVWSLSEVRMAAQEVCKIFK